MNDTDQKSRVNAFFMPENNQIRRTYTFLLNQYCFVKIGTKLAIENVIRSEYALGTLHIRRFPISHADKMPCCHMLKTNVDSFFGLIVRINLLRYQVTKIGKAYG